MDVTVLSEGRYRCLEISLANPRWESQVGVPRVYKTWDGSPVGRSDIRSRPVASLIQPYFIDFIHPTPIRSQDALLPAPPSAQVHASLWHS